MSGLVKQIGARSGVVGSTTNSTQLDYEEGTFPHTLLNGGVHSSFANGRYTKIGRMVTVYGQMLVGIGSSDGLRITSLPFTASNAGGPSRYQSSGSLRTYNAVFPSNTNGVVVQIFPDTTNLYFYANVSGGVSADLPTTYNAYYTYTITYETA